MLQRLVKTKNVSSQSAPLTGFTIVELLIVIVVIGILASITVVAFRGVQQRATSTAYVSSIDHWEKVMRAEYATTGKLPTTASYICLGTAASNFSANSEMVSGSCGQLVDSTGAVFNFMYDQSFTDQFQLKSNFRNGLLSQIKRQPLPDNGSVIMRGAMVRITNVSGTTRVDLVWYPEAKNTCGRGADAWAAITTITVGGCTISFDLV